MMTLHRQHENIRVREESRLTISSIAELRFNSPRTAGRGTILRRFGISSGLLSLHTGIHVESAEYSGQGFSLSLRGE